MIRKLFAFVVVCSLAVGLSARAADDATQPAGGAKKAGVTEGEFAKWLVETLGLARTLPAGPTENQCVAVLLQNGITPKNGWNSTNLVTWATLARTVVQSMGKADEVQDPDNDKAWIDYLASIGVVFANAREALDQIPPSGSALNTAAVNTSTDPLSKKARTNPSGEEQLGVDMQSIREAFEVVPPPEPPKPPVPPRPRPPKPVTRN